MWEVIKTVFGSGDVVSKGFDLIDSMHTSKEEEVQVKTAAKVAMLQAYAPFKLAQRIIAFSFTFVFLVCFATAFGHVMISGKPFPDQLTTLMGEFWIGEIMLVIVGFYFGGGAIEGIRNSGGKK